MGTYLDQAGLAHVWDKAKTTFVIAEEGKGLSSNDFTDEWKQKIEDLAYEPMAISAFLQQREYSRDGKHRRRGNPELDAE